MRIASFVAIAGLLSACASFPDDGPSSRAVSHHAAVKGAGPYALVDLNYRTSEIVSATPGAPLAGLARSSSDAPHDRIQPGDVLSVQIFEPGATNLFMVRQSPESPVTPGLGHLVVADDGSVQIPYGGAPPVAGLTPAEAAAVIRQALQGKVYDAQVLVSVLASNANAVSVIGEVRNAGRYGLSAHSDRLLDILASAGGPTRPPRDILVVVVRGDLTAVAPLALLLNQSDQNVRLAPGDQVRLLYRPRKYSTFGAMGRSAEIPIEDDTLTLAGAISRSGGLEPNSADPAWVLLFRFERPEVASRLGVSLAPTPKGVPMVYRLNLRDPSGYLVANSFNVQAGDLLYVPRSDVTELRKFIDLVSVISQVTYNVRVSTVLP
jgi:polysaccharide export outer membrane protein